MERISISRNEIINQLLKIGHKNLGLYIEPGVKAVMHDSELFAHMIAWNEKKGKVRDTKVALPVIALRGLSDEELYENAVAHLCKLDPRNLLRAIQFHKSFKTPVGIGAGKLMKNAVKLYIAAREKNRGWWNTTVVQHRKSMKALYAYYHIKPPKFAQDILFNDQKPKGSVFEAIAQLKNMGGQEAAGAILNFKIPYLVAVSAAPNIKNNVDVILALIERMSGNELITNTNMLKSLGTFTSPVLKAAYDKAMERARKDTRVSTLKAGKAAEIVTGTAKTKLKKIEQEQLDKLGGIDGDWLVLGDMSGSMENAIELACQVSGLIAEQVKGKVYLIFFNQAPKYYDVSNKTYDEIKDLTKRIIAVGATSIGVGLDYLLTSGQIVNGIAICSDGGENTAPSFAPTYKKYTEKYMIEPPVYFFRVPGDPDRLSTRCKIAGVILETFDLDSDVDFYSLPNIIPTLKTSRYMLVDEIMETPLLKLSDVFGM